VTLNVTSMCKSFGRRKALDGVSLHVPPANFWPARPERRRQDDTIPNPVRAVYCRPGRAEIGGADIAKAPILPPFFRPYLRAKFFPPRFFYFFQRGKTCHLDSGE